PPAGPGPGRRPPPPPPPRARRRLPRRPRRHRRPLRNPFRRRRPRLDRRVHRLLRDRRVRRRLRHRPRRTRTCMTRVDRACLIALAIAGGVCTPLSARAQSAEAEALFRDGRELIKAGKLAAGCERLAASERLESSVGTLLNLGDCREKLGKLASAWAAFRKAEALAKRTPGDERRQAEAARR